MHGLIKTGEINHVNSRDIKTSRFGIGLEKVDRELYDPDPCYDPIAEIGVKWVRIQSGWPRTEKTRGAYDFSWLDSMVDNLVKRNLEPWICLCYGNQLYTPGANNRTGGIGYPPISSAEEKGAWNSYVKACVSRYKGKVNYFEVWNEPDGLYCWRYGVNASEYGQFAKDTAIAAKEANPEARILAASFCTANLSYLNEMLTVCAQYIDYVTYHNYKFDVEKGTLDFYNAMRAVINIHNPKVGIIQGETGTQSRYSEHGALRYADWNERRQAKYL